MTPTSQPLGEPLPQSDARWPLWARVGFRLAFLYWLLYILPSAGGISLLDLLPWDTTRLSGWIAWPLAQLAHLVGVGLFHLTGEGADWHPTGSGDTAMNYVLVLCIAVLAMVGTAVWSSIAELRGCRGYNTGYAWLRLVLRFTLAVTLIEYGFLKVFPEQFGVGPRLWELNETYGESSPMHMLWFFIGISRPYTVFGGLAEVVPGVLLLFRRTSTLGLLGAVAVMANVTALNFCYDVPVKLYSTHLLLMSLFLLLPDLRPMWRFFAQRKEAVLVYVQVRKPERRALRFGAHVFQALVLLSCVWLVIQVYKERELAPTPAPLRGMWAVDGVEGWPDENAPKTLVLDNNSSALVVLKDNKRKHYPVAYNLANRSLRFTELEKPTKLQWEQTDGRKAKLQGTWMSLPVTLKMHRTDPDTYLLMTRGFHWVQEMPFNK